MRCPASPCSFGQCGNVCPCALRFAVLRWASVCMSCCPARFCPMSCCAICVVSCYRVLLSVVVWSSVLCGAVVRCTVWCGDVPRRVVLFASCYFAPRSPLPPAAAVLVVVLCLMCCPVLPFSRVCIVLCRVVLVCLRRVVQRSGAPCCLCCLVLWCVVLCCAASFGAVWCVAAPHCLVQCCDVVVSAMLCSVVLFVCCSAPFLPARMYITTLSKPLISFPCVTPRLSRCPLACW